MWGSARSPAEVSRWRRSRASRASRVIPMMAMLSVSVASLSIATVARADDGDPKRGHIIARQYCSPCHAVEAKQKKSPVADAPPFRTFASKWPLEDIEEALAEGIMVGHEGIQMPVFELDPAAIADLIAYLRTIQDPVPPAAPSQPPKPKQ